MHRTTSTSPSWMILALLAPMGCASAPIATRSAIPMSLAGGVPSVTGETDASPRCGSAYRRLCGPGSDVSDARALRHKDIASEIERATLEALASELGLESASTEAWRAYLASQPSERRRELMVRHRRDRAVEVARRIAPLEPIVRAEHERLRAVALTRLRAATPLDRSRIERLERSELGWIELAPDAEIPRAVRRGCGDDLLIDDAWVTKDVGSLTLCPGFLLVSARSSAPDVELRQAIAFLLAHELGHVIVGPTSSLREARDAERLADEWAAQILGADLEAMSDRQAREDYLRRTVEPICSLRSDATHAAGRVRIERVVEHEPRFASALVCDVDPVTH